MAKFLLATSVGSLLLAQLCCTVAAVPTLIRTARPAGPATTEENISTIHSSPAEADGNADKNDYLQSMRSLQDTLQRNGCKTTSFNGQPVSAHYCTASSIKVTTPEFTCDQHLVVTLPQNKLHEKAVGSELALFKVPETNLSKSDRLYQVSILHKGRPLLVHRAPASSSGWQLYRLELLRGSHSGGSKLNLTLRVSALWGNGNSLLSCANLSSLFVLNSKKLNSLKVTRHENTKSSNLDQYLPVFVTFFKTSRAECNHPFCRRTLMRPKRQRQFLPFCLNNYVTTMYMSYGAIKTSNCTATILGQNVSYNFCKSNKIVFDFANSTIPADEIPPDGYRVCFNITASSNEIVLGADLIIHKKLPQNKTFDTMDVFLIEYVGDSALHARMIADSTIPMNASGWLVFHVDNHTKITSRKDNELLCVNVYIRVNNESNVTTFLSASKLSQILTVDRASCKEPFMTTFVYKNISRTPQLFKKKRSLESHPLTNNMKTSSCVRQKHVVNLSSYMHKPDVYPQKADVGQCVVTHDIKSGEGKNITSSIDKDESIRRVKCLPTKFKGLDVIIRDETHSTSLTSPKIVVAECDWSESVY